MSEYPFLEIVTKKSKAKGHDVLWVATQADRTERWIRGVKSINDVQLGILMKISEALDFDLLADYYEFLGKEKTESFHMLNEPGATYNRTKSDTISIQVTVTGSTKQLGKVMESIVTAGEKEGFRVG